VLATIESGRDGAIKDVNHLIDLAVIMRCRHPRVRRHDELKHDDASRGPDLIHKEAKLQAAYSNDVIASCVHGASLPRKVAGRQFS
jgi:hypothetical protein